MDHQSHSSHIELSKSNYKKNLRFLQKTFGKEVKISSVIKGNAYGHGISSFVPLAEECGIDHFSVFSASEAEETLASINRDQTRIMIMGDLHPDEIPWAIENNISFFVYNLEALENTINASGKVQKTAHIHLELETGMNRFGLDLLDLEKAVPLIMANPESVKVQGICTHYAGAESVSNYLRIQNQKLKFSELCDWIEKQGIKGYIKHSASSSAALNYPETRMDMVRIGIAQYGFWPTPEVRVQYFINKQKDFAKRMVDPLKGILTWKSRIINIKEVPPGEFVGYGNSYLTTTKTTVAAVPVGYYHGFARSLSNSGRVLVNGKRSTVVGVVNMNMMLIKVNDVKNVKIGDEVVIIGTQNKHRISVASFSEMTNNLNYEILTRLPKDIPRIIIG